MYQRTKTFAESNYCRKLVFLLEVMNNPILVLNKLCKESLCTFPRNDNSNNLSLSLRSTCMWVMLLDLNSCTCDGVPEV